MPPDIKRIRRVIVVGRPHLDDKMRYAAVVPGALLRDKTSLCQTTKSDSVMGDPENDQPSLDQIEDFVTDLAID